MIEAMTPEEREKPELLAESPERRKRVAEDSGKTEQQVSQLVAQIFQMRVRMKNLMGVMEGGSIPALSQLEDAMKAQQRESNWILVNEYYPGSTWNRKEEEEKGGLKRKNANSPPPNDTVSPPSATAIPPTQLTIHQSPRHLSSKKSSVFLTRANSLKPFENVKPYLQSESRTILAGWLCSFVSLPDHPQDRLLHLQPHHHNPLKLRNAGIVLAALFLARVVAGYLQQAYLWEASLNSVYRIRVGESLSSSKVGMGSRLEILRIVSLLKFPTLSMLFSIFADYELELLQTVVPSAFQISAMATHMVVASPVLTLVSAMVITHSVSW
ncbi:hypothetical protein Bca52824_025315 [Brassica carinata]|uniref:Signal recognition particle SRP54 subunit M-domain domain-containing protein n=1 Tax=Brassica carinata TaxID=52824 RepID=A0A8X7VL84_BRACI|nr:hypothetical protein Bca52824_025315 [Brassica carinata]